MSHKSASLVPSSSAITSIAGKRCTSLHLPPPSSNRTSQQLFVATASHITMSNTLARLKNKPLRFGIRKQSGFRSSSHRLIYACLQALHSLLTSNLRCLSILIHLSRPTRRPIRPTLSNLSGNTAADAATCLSTGTTAYSRNSSHLQSD